MSKAQARAARLAGQCTQQAQLPQLPEAVLVSILQYVPTADRLVRCALVCKAWASAVASTTVHLEAEPDLMLSKSWLEQWGPQVASIRLEYPEAIYGEDLPSGSLRLPTSKFSRLETLSLQNVCWAFHTQNGSNSSFSTGQVSTVLAASNSNSRGSSRSINAAPTAAGASGPDAFLPQLRDLRLSDCWVRLARFQQLSKLTALTELHLVNIQVYTSKWRCCDEGRYTAALTTLLQHTQALQRLILQHCIRLQQPGAALAPLSTMQRLQRLVLGDDTCDTDGLKYLPTSLTYLHLRGRDLPGAVDVAVTTDSLPQLSLLQDLDLKDVQLNPGVFGQLSALRNLGLHSVALGEPDDDDWDEVEELKALLMALGQLTQLESLSLVGMSLDEVYDLELFTALTASSQLTALHLWHPESVPLPPGALQHMLPHNRQLPQLKALHLGASEPDYDFDEPCVGVLDIDRIASCLPALEVLSLHEVVPGLATVAKLTQLLHGSPLRSLSVGGVAFDNCAAVQVAQLTSLHSLEWSSSGITTWGLQCLTALKGLVSLKVEDCPDLHEDVLNTAGPYVQQVALELTSSKEAAAAGTPDVWLQLQQQCDKDPACRRARMQAGQTAAGMC